MQQAEITIQLQMHFMFYEGEKKKIDNSQDANKNPKGRIVNPGKLFSGLETYSENYHHLSN